MTYAEAIEFLYGLRLFGTKFGLENTLELTRLNGNPHESLRFIHVAGTNGKGSTCAILESIYRANGLKVGLFTSPHLVSFTERMQVNRVCISEADVTRLTSKIIETLGGPEMERWSFRPTFFEFITVMALRYFQEQKCDLVVWETGMGGRLDATNIVTPLAGVITNIQRDHQQWLGNTTEEIAAEKAGIIKPGVPVVTGAEPGPALEVIRATAARVKAPFIHVRRGDDFARQFDELLGELPLAGEHQVMNATLALAVLCVLSERFPISAEALPRGIRGVQWPGRFQVVQRREGQIVLDGAHNVDGARTLSEALKHKFPGIPVTLILGLFKDKEWREMCDTLVPYAARLFLVPVSSERTVDPGEAHVYCAEKRPSLEIRAFANLADAIAASKSDRVVVIAGSLHLIGEAMEVLHVSTAARSERGLNEWNAANAPMR